MEKMDNAEVKTEADLLNRKACLSNLLASYPNRFVGSTYSYDLMFWRDLDIYVLILTMILGGALKLAMN
jgi:hypothetical protein